MSGEYQDFPCGFPVGVDVVDQMERLTRRFNLQNVTRKMATVSDSRFGKNKREVRKNLADAQRESLNSFTSQPLQSWSERRINSLYCLVMPETRIAIYFSRGQGISLLQDTIEGQLLYVYLNKRYGKDIAAKRLNLCENTVKLGIDFIQKAFMEYDKAKAGFVSSLLETFITTTRFNKGIAVLLSDNELFQLWDDLLSTDQELQQQAANATFALAALAMDRSTLDYVALMLPDVAQKWWSSMFNTPPLSLNDQGEPFECLINMIDNDVDVDVPVVAGKSALILCLLNVFRQQTVDWQKMANNGDIDLVINRVEAFIRYSESLLPVFSFFTGDTANDKIDELVFILRNISELLNVKESSIDELTELLKAIQCHELLFKDDTSRADNLYYLGDICEHIYGLLEYIIDVVNNIDATQTRLQKLLTDPIVNREEIEACYKEHDEYQKKLKKITDESHPFDYYSKFISNITISSTDALSKKDIAEQVVELKLQIKAQKDAEMNLKMEYDQILQQKQAKIDELSLVIEQSQKTVVDINQ